MFLFGKASMDTALPATRTRNSVSGNVTVPIWLEKCWGNPRRNVGFKKQWCWWMCVLALMWWKVTGGLQSCPAAVLSFFRYSGFFFLFLFSFSQSFWPCPFFFLQGAMLSWKSYNLNRFAKPTRCHPFNSFLQQPCVIICIVVILFATRGSTPLKKKWSWWRN